MRDLLMMSSFIAMLVGGCAPTAKDYRVNQVEPVILELAENDGKTPSADSPNVYAVKAEERIFYVLGKSGEDGIRRFCSEPPETAVNIAEALASAIGAGVKVGSQVDVSFDQEASRILAQSVSQLFVPSQGLQFYRNGLLGLCQSASNKSVAEAQFEDLYKQLVEESAKLISLEIEKKAVSSATSVELGSILDQLAVINNQLGIKPENIEPQDNATEDPQSESYIATIKIAGSGKVNFDSREDCAVECIYPVSSGDIIQFTATAGTGNEFDKWTGCQPVNETKCKVIFDADKEIIAVFKKK